MVLKRLISCKMEQARDSGKGGGRMEKTVAVVLAAGAGKRMHSKVPKQYLLLCGRPVLYYTLKALQESFIDEIVLVAGAGEIEYCRLEIVEKYAFSKVTHITKGGRERYHSVYHGLMAAAACFGDGGDGIVFIHDGARPFVTDQILERVRLGAREYGACAAGMPAKDTIKIVDENNISLSTPNRKHVWMVQTPQAFSYRLACLAYGMLMQEESSLLAQGICVTDDTMVVEHFLKHPARMVEGSYANMKITTPEDLKAAEAFLGG